MVGNKYKKKKKERAPEVLWRLFKHEAKPLSTTILSLLPDQNSAMSSVLVRADDPSDYRFLLKNCFVVLPNDAPPPQTTPFRPVNRWSQEEIVRRTIEMIMYEKPKAGNLICTSYDKCQRSSSIVDLLTSSAWTLLSKRVGDDLMFYILKHASIFVPLRHKNHLQVTGSPISEFVIHPWKRTAQRQHQLPIVTQFGNRKKRKRADDPDEIYRRSEVEHSENQYDQIRLSEAAASTTGSSTTYCQSNSNAELQGLKPRKRSRPCKWHRCKKSKHFETMGKTFGRTVFVEEDNLTGRYQHDFTSSSCYYNQEMQESQQCQCCLLLQAACLPMKVGQVDRGPIFYNLVHHPSVLPRRHILFSLKPNLCGAKSLLCGIFGVSQLNLSSLSMLCSHHSGGRLADAKCLFNSLVKSFKALIRRTQCCKHLSLLDKHCGNLKQNPNLTGDSSSVCEVSDLVRGVCKKSHLGDAGQCMENVENIEFDIETINSCCSKAQVVSYVWAVCRNLVPTDLLGSPSCWRALRSNIAKFIQLRRYEKFSLKQCMHKLKTSEFPFLFDDVSSFHLGSQVLNSKSEKSSNRQMNLHHLKHHGSENLKKMLLEKWIVWLFSSLIVPLVQANFYVTESDHGKQDIFYYKKSVWQKMSKIKSDECLEGHKYESLHVTDVEQIISCRSFGFSKLRLRPKQNGVRMIANLKAKSKVPVLDSFGQIKFKNADSVNNIFRDAHAVLKELCLERPEILGSSVSDYNDVYKKLFSFITLLKNGSNVMPDVFIVVSDVSRAFDSIDQEKMLQAIEDVLCEDEFLVKQSHQLVCTTKSLWAQQISRLTYPNASDDFTGLGSFINFGPLHTVFVDQGRQKSLKKQEILFSLHEHLRRNVLQLDDKFYLQRIGIPQGSVLSSLLCSLYYGHLERNVIYPYLSETNERATEERSLGHYSHGVSSVSEDRITSSPHYMLLRFIDDFLFISTSKSQAVSFFNRLCGGFDSYNCYMNEGKFGTSFDAGQASSPISNRNFIGEDGNSFVRWSGLFLNSCTLEVQADYTRYLNNHLRSTLTVCWHGKPGRHLKLKLRVFLRPKCHPLLFDSNINSAPVVRLNVYQTFLLAAMKFHCYVSDLSYICRFSSRFYLEAIERSLRYLYLLIKKRMHSSFRDSLTRPVLHLKKAEVEWLGLNAYIKVLKRKQSRHKKLLSLLNSKLSAHEICDNVSPPLRYAVDSSHSSFMFKIKY